MIKVLETEPLILRTWTDSDLQPMYEINQGQKVMAYFPKTQCARGFNLISLIYHDNH